MDLTRARRAAVVLCGVALVFGAHAAVAAADGGYTTDPTAAPDPPLTQSTSLTLHGSGGDVQAVVYDGNQMISGSSLSTTLGGFTVPSGSIVAHTTYVVADGQCGFGTPNGCAGVPTGGGSDTLSFSGGAGTLGDGPDAFKGSDGCPWGPDTCLWDTRTFDVSGEMAAGDTSATATVTANGDCLNPEAQVFAVGPASAWSGAGYTAAGVGLRDQASGTITLSGVPSGARIVKALLYWNVLDNADSGASIAVNGSGATGTMIGQAASPCWPASASFAYRADVTSLVSGNGAYTISGYPTSDTSGQNPWAVRALPPMMEGASLIVFYETSQTFNVSFSTFIQTNYVVGPPQAKCIQQVQLFPPKVVIQQEYFAGDDRLFDPNATSFRTRQTVGVASEQSASPSGVVTAASNQVGQSREYAEDALAGDNRLDPGDDDGVLNDCHLLVATGFASTSDMHVDVTRVNEHTVQVHMYGGAGNPLVFGAPEINWDMTLTIDTSGSVPHWTLTGSHDGFPSYEVYVNGQALHTYSPGPGPYGFGDLLKLFPGHSITVNASGDLK